MFTTEEYTDWLGYYETTQISLLDIFAYGLTFTFTSWMVYLISKTAGEDCT